MPFRVRGLGEGSKFESEKNKITTLNSPRQHHHQKHHQYNTNNTTGPITPPTAMRPTGNGPYQYQYQNNDQNCPYTHLSPPGNPLLATSHHGCSPSILREAVKNICTLAHSSGRKSDRHAIYTYSSLMCFDAQRKGRKCSMLKTVHTRAGTNFSPPPCNQNWIGQRVGRYRRSPMFRATTEFNPENRVFQS